MTTLILGFGVSGRATAALLKSRGLPFVAVDRNGPVLDAPDFPLHNISLVVLSPGIPPTHPIVQRALEKGIEVIGEVELAFRYLKNPCIGVTGSNGKTTTCSLIAHVLGCQAVGNIGSPLSAVKHDELLVVELSSFQLETLTKKFDLGIVLNIMPNHLDRYASMEEYARAKARLKADRLLISEQVARDWGGLFSGAEIFEVARICPEVYTQLGVQNVVCAELVCAQFGVGKERFLEALQTFKKPPHRVEFVHEKEGIRYYNDSKATSVEAVLHAMGMMDRKVVLIAGGVHKGSSYRPWIGFRDKVKKIVAYGEAGPILEEELDKDFVVERVLKFGDAVKCAKASAKTGECVLLSPGCSSYDQFNNYEERGDAFKKEVIL